MKYTYLLTMLLFPLAILGQNKPLPEKYQPQLLGEVKPAGWIKTQMRQDLRGFTGNLDRLVPDLIQKPATIPSPTAGAGIADPNKTNHDSRRR